jgi:hypothetical protein
VPNCFQQPRINWLFVTKRVVNQRHANRHGLLVAKLISIARGHPPSYDGRILGHGHVASNIISALRNIGEASYTPLRPVGLNVTKTCVAVFVPGRFLLRDWNA